MNKIIYAETITNNVIEEMRAEHNDGRQIDSVEYRARITSANDSALHGFPLYLGIVEGVHYDSKAGVYTVRHQFGTARCSDDVGAYLLEHAFKRSMRPMVNAEMVKGTIIGVALRFLSDKD